MNYKDEFRLISILLSVLPLSAYALGTIELDSSSFVYKSDARGNSATSADVFFAGSSDSRILHAKFEAGVYSYLGASPQAAFDVRDTYLSTQKDLLPNQEITVGRRYYEWSKVDHEWSMMSLWSPRFTWDSMHPESVGMTGVFYEWKNRGFSLLAFASPVAIPEMGTQTSVTNGKIVSTDPLTNPLPTQENVEGAMTNVEYSLNMPPLNQILLRPNFALRGKYSFDSGAWMSMNSGVMPVNMTQLAAEPFINATTGVLDVTVHPEFPMRNINTAEFGYNSPDEDWDLWMSGSYETPFNFVNQSNWLNPAITPTSIISAGTDVQLTSNFRFNGGVLFIHEQPFHSSSDLANVDVTLPTRFPINQAIKIGGEWRYSDYTQTTMSWIQDLVEQNHLVSLDFQHKLHRSNIVFGAGADVIFAATTQGWIGQYYGNDRLRGWLKYAF